MGRSKLMVERMLLDCDMAYGTKSVSLRYFNAAGADPEGDIGEIHDPEPHLVPLVLQVASGEKEHISVFGNDYKTPDGTCIRDYIHVTDLAEAHVLGLRKLCDSMKTDFYNLGNGLGYSVNDVIQTAKQITGREIPSVIAGRRPGDPACLIADSTKARTELSWKPSYADMSVILDTAWKWECKKNDVK